MVPKRNECSFGNWWGHTVRKVRKEHRKGLNSLIITSAWLIWKQRNACVFEGASSSISEVMRTLKDEYKMWCLAGAKKLHALNL
ncbi:hypothetical protein PR202_gb22293 [Eleusine coracana subsp. coracana]|uniref:Uncharacterized protein n=1 Tax=Eleusine coracana subsp. coracana TaxID=191504 RepID=A0AAV5FFX7_ELECO|nr:hypothetical protein PR202_gb22293 [Eleusine coracana subsp. coracana]